MNVSIKAGRHVTYGSGEDWKDTFQFISHITLVGDYCFRGGHSYAFIYMRVYR